MVHIKYKKLNEVISCEYECKRAVLKHIKPTFYVKIYSFSINAPVFYVEDGVEVDSRLDLIGPGDCMLAVGTAIAALARLLKEDPREDFNLEQLVNLPCRVVVDPAKSSRCIVAIGHPTKDYFLLTDDLLSYDGTVTVPPFTFYLD